MRSRASADWPCSGKVEIPKLIVSDVLRVARHERLVHRRADALGEHEGAVLVAVGREHGELLPSHARGAVEAALGAGDGGRDAREHLVAGRVAVRVVHALEAVEVADDQAERLVRAPGALELGVEHVLEAAPVEQAGEVVAVGGVAEPADQRGDVVAHHRHEQARR